MKRRTLLATALALPASAALAQQTPLGLLNALGGAGPEHFIDMAGMSDLFEIESSRILLIGSRHPQIREFAQMMIEHHTRSTNELRLIPAAAARNPVDLDERHERLLNVLRAAQGDLLDRTYIDQQVDAHIEAIQLYEVFLQNRTPSPLRDFAERNLPMIREHLARARAFQVPTRG